MQTLEPWNCNAQELLLVRMRTTWNRFFFHFIKKTLILCGNIFFTVVGWLFSRKCVNLRFHRFEDTRAFVRAYANNAYEKKVVLNYSECDASFFCSPRGGDGDEKKSQSWNREILQCDITRIMEGKFVSCQKKKTSFHASEWEAGFQAIMMTTRSSKTGKQRNQTLKFWVCSHIVRLGIHHYRFAF